MGNADGQTPLHHAVCTGNADVVQLLLDEGANPNVVNKHNKRPLDLTKVSFLF